MRDQIDSDITFYMYATIEFIENAIKESDGKAKILVHCFKVNYQALIGFREILDQQQQLQPTTCGKKDSQTQNLLN